MTHHYLIPALIAGLIQGIVEWLPVSSKTMITIYFTVMGIKVQNAYDLGLIANFGSFFAALYYFRREVVQTIKALGHPFGSDYYARLLRFLFVATLATGVTGIPAYIVVRHAFSSIGGSAAMVIVGILLVFTGFVVRNKEKMVDRSQAATTETSQAGSEHGRVPGFWAAVVTGAMQGLAGLPGISRSGMTITPLLWFGFEAREAIRFSFMLDVLALVGAGLVPLLIGHGGTAAVAQLGLTTTILMIAVASVVSFMAITGVLRLASRWRTSTATFVIAGITLVVALLALAGV
ncbi:undecaprenyl-diphosphate phosphatase [Sulfobacillus harzensis]|uniref:Undecaprenyl-diphosphatase n=1 Tax=Sulfobacillus harzensis TaxID=2729629 RepID=A0A7Y0L3A8_9FIRM|nr:undecaprenyl-diphosphate phosphatase [Sulfobacillus harzensis]NMP22521.1 undecaprenyl-diphosphate phosphatase [Sulfobacillus harzensis]